VNASTLLVSSTDSLSIPVHPRHAVTLNPRQVSRTEKSSKAPSFMPGMWFGRVGSCSNAKPYQALRPVLVVGGAYGVSLWIEALQRDHELHVARIC